MENIAMRSHSKSMREEEEKLVGPRQCPSTFSVGLVVLQLDSLQINAKTFTDCYTWSH